MLNYKWIKLTSQTIIKASWFLFFFLNKISDKVILNKLWTSMNVYFVVKRRIEITVK